LKGGFLMNSDNAYNQNYDLFVSLLAEMVVSYISNASHGKKNQEEFKDLINGKKENEKHVK
jgi:hypothetical protein